MSQAIVETKAAVVSKKIKIKKKLLGLMPVANKTTTAPQKQQSVWLSVRNRTPPVKKTIPIVWEHIEDISDDEDDTPEAAEERAETMKEMKAQLNRRIYEIKLEELQSAGLFLTWSEEKP